MSEHKSPDEQLREILDPDVELPGRRLREAREATQMSREEVAHHLHLDPQIVTALETDNYEKLPSPIYICGYLRSYARLVKLPEAEIVNAYSKGQEINASLIPENVNILPDKQVINPAIFKTVGLIILAVLALLGITLLGDKFGLLGFLQNDPPPVAEQSAPLMESGDPIETVQDIMAEVVVADQSVNEPDTEPVASSLPPSNDEIEQKISDFEQAVSQNTPPVVIEQGISETGGPLKFVFNEESWIEVKDRNGQQLVYRLARAGTELQVSGDAPYRILLGNAAGVDVYYNEKIFDHKPFRRNRLAFFRLGTDE